MNQTLMTIALEAAAFFELAEDELIDPDAAGDQIDGIISVLADLSPDERAEFNNYAIDYANIEESKGGMPERIAFFRSFGRQFGLLD